MLKIIIHGVRGSSPAIGQNFTKYGGNTTCIEVQTKSYRLILDTGSGFKNIDFFKTKKQTAILYTHFHHDHIQGLSNNPSLFNKRPPIKICSAMLEKAELKKILSNYYSPKFFPIILFSEYDNFIFYNFDEIKREILDEIAIEYAQLNHPGGACGYKIRTKNNSAVFLFDNEINNGNHLKLIEFCRDVDIVFWDGMFTDQEYKTKIGWGHSTIEQGYEFLQSANVKDLYICHHAPWRTDTEIDQLSALYPKNLIFAAEGATIEL